MENQGVEESKKIVLIRAQMENQGPGIPLGLRQRGARDGENSVRRALKTLVHLERAKD